MYLKAIWKHRQQLYRRQEGSPAYEAGYWERVSWGSQGIRGQSVSDGSSEILRFCIFLQEHIGNSWTQESHWLCRMWETDSVAKLPGSLNNVSMHKGVSNRRSTAYRDTRSCSQQTTSLASTRPILEPAPSSTQTSSTFHCEKGHMNTKTPLLRAPCLCKMWLWSTHAHGHAQGQSFSIHWASTSSWEPDWGLGQTCQEEAGVLSLPCSLGLRAAEPREGVESGSP